jgi:hypothetical protein
MAGLEQLEIHSKVGRLVRLVQSKEGSSRHIVIYCSLGQN